MLHKGFQPLTTFRSPGEPYRLLPFRFMRWDATEALLVNDVGELCFLPSEKLALLSRGALSREDPIFRELQAKHMVCDEGATLPLELLATKYRTKMAHLAGFSKLHMFVVTLRCEHSCRYCQVSRATEDRTRFDMSPETARKAVDLMFCSPSKALKVEFQGGEPLLHFDLLRSIVESVEDRNEVEQRDLEFVVATNLVPLTDEILSFLAEHRVHVSTSLDGPETLHNANRPRPGNDSYQRVIANLDRVREAMGANAVSAIMTTTERSFRYPHEIVDEYVRLGFASIFVRPISPYGFAVRTGEAALYQMDQFLEFYQDLLNYIIEINRRGTPFEEVYAQILLSKILTPFAQGYVDLQSPAGAAIGCVAYNYDGRVFASDEARMLAEMGDESFCLGRVDDGYQALFAGEIAQALVAGTVLEALPGCSDCAFLPFCGADPVYHHRIQGDIVGRKPTSPFCHKNMSILRFLLNLYRTGDAFTRSLLTEWATGSTGIDRGSCGGLQA